MLSPLDPVVSLSVKGIPIYVVYQATDPERYLWFLCLITWITLITKSYWFLPLHSTHIHLLLSVCTAPELIWTFIISGPGYHYLSSLVSSPGLSKSSLLSDTKGLFPKCNLLMSLIFLKMLSISWRAFKVSPTFVANIYSPSWCAPWLWSSLILHQALPQEYSCHTYSNL